MVLRVGDWYRDYGDGDFIMDCYYGVFFYLIWWENGVLLVDV